MDDDDARSFLLRGDLPVSALGGDWLVRATLPINTVPDLTGASDVTDPGDFNIFAAYMIDTGRPALSFAIGPS